MTIHDVAAFLTRFDAPPPIALEEKEADEAVVETEVARLPEDEGILESERDAIRAEIEAQFREELAAERRGFEQRLLAARAEWSSQTAEELCRLIAKAFDDGFATLRQDVAAVLSPFISQEIVARTLDEAIDAARATLREECPPALNLRGPKDLLDKLRDALSDNDIVVSTQEADTLDARVDVAKTRIETRLGEWMRRLCDDRSSQ